MMSKLSHTILITGAIHHAPMSFALGIMASIYLTIIILHTLF